MKLLLILVTFLSMNSYSQTYDESSYGYEDTIMEDEMMRQEAGYDPQIHPDEYYDVYDEEMERQEEIYYPEEESDWTLNGEELPVEEL